MNSTGRKMANVLDSVDSGPAGVWRFVTESTRRRTVLVALVVIAVIATAAVPVRDTVGTANIALAMAIVVVFVGARAGLWPGTIVAVVSGLTFALLHTVPHGLPTVESEQDAATAALLVASGVLAGFVHDRTERLESRLVDTGYGLRRLHRVAEVAAAVDADPGEVIDVVTHEISDELDLATCRRVREPLGARRELQHNGLVAGMAFEPTPAALAAALVDGVGIDLHDGSHLELVGRPDADIDAERLRIAIMLADYAAAVLAPQRHRD